MTEPNDPTLILGEPTTPLLPAPAHRAWKDRVPPRVATAVDRALDAADEVADELRRAASDVARAARDATR